MNLSDKELMELCRKHKAIFKGYSRQKNNIRKFVKERTKRINRIRGGRGDSLTFFNVSWNELNMGIIIEYEHARDYWISIDIAYDHLAEIPDYYTRLRNLERKAEREWKYKNSKDFVFYSNLRDMETIKKFVQKRS